MFQSSLKLIATLTILFWSSPLFAAVEIGAPAPDFATTDVSGESISLKELRGNYVVLEWFNIGCPYVRKHYNNNDMQALQKSFKENGISWIIVNSTEKNHQDFRDKEETKKLIAKLGINSSAFILDESGEIGKSFSAKTTPHLFIIDPQGVLVYQGAIDDMADVDSDPKDANNYLKAALEEIIAKKKISTADTKAYGCSIKYAQ